MTKLAKLPTFYFLVLSFAFIFVLYLALQIIFYTKDCVLSIVFTNFFIVFFVMPRKVDLSMFSTFERIKELAKIRGVSLIALEEKLNLSRNSIYTIKTKKPSAERLQLIADYFNVSTDYLLGRTDNPKIAKDDDTIAGYTQLDITKMAEQAMMYDGKPLSDKDKEAIQSIIEIYLRSKEN